MEREREAADAERHRSWTSIRLDGGLRRPAHSDAWLHSPIAAQESVNPSSFATFIHSFDRLVGACGDAERIRRGGIPLLRSLVAGDEWLAPEHALADPLRHRQILLHLDPARRYSVVACVWGPKQRMPLHDHPTWSLVGMLRGVEVSQRYRIGRGDRPLPEGMPIRRKRGQVDIVGVAERDVRTVRNGADDGVSISIRVYGGDIGTMPGSIYFPDGSREPFLSGYTPSVPSPSEGEDTTNSASTSLLDLVPELAADAVRADLLARREIALLDVREEHEFAQAHPLWAANLPLSRIEPDAWGRLPCRDTRVVVYGSPDGPDAHVAGTRLRSLGYKQVFLLEDGLAGWSAAGGELFAGLHVPSESFGIWAQDRRNEVPGDACGMPLGVDLADRNDPAPTRARVDARTCSVLRLSHEQWQQWGASGRTTYAFDIRAPEAYEASHLAPFRNAPAARLLRETDRFAPVRGARIVLVDHDGTTGGTSVDGAHADKTATALEQMGWEVGTLGRDDALCVARGKGPDNPVAPMPPRIRPIDSLTLADWLAREPGTVRVLDFASSDDHVKGHIPGAWFVLRSRLRQVFKAGRGAHRFVLTCTDGLLAAWAARDLEEILGVSRSADIRVLQGGTAAWRRAGLPLRSGERRLKSPRIDRYRPPQAGAAVQPGGTQACADRSSGLVAQLDRDGTHFFTMG